MEIGLFSICFGRNQIFDFCFLTNQNCSKRGDLIFEQNTVKYQLIKKIKLFGIDQISQINFKKQKHSKSGSKIARNVPKWPIFDIN